MDCFFNVYKPKGPTSHDVVARLRRAGKVRRIGHAGTLDPLAEGVLVIAAGRATRLIEYLVDADKAYAAEVTFGVETDTYDAEGRVTAQRPAAHLTEAVVRQALETFRGSILQRPPSFSAVSVGGQRLYALARRGAPVVIPPRAVTISRLELVAWRPPLADLHVECSKGTYIRSLAHDLGQALGCGAHLSALVRLRVGRFASQEATPLAELEERLRDGLWQAVSYPAEAAVAHLVTVRLDAAGAARLASGQPVPFRAPLDGETMDGQAPDDQTVNGREAGGQTTGVPARERQGATPLEGEEGPASGTLGRAYAADGRFMAVVRLVRSGDLLVWRPEKVLAS